MSNARQNSSNSASKKRKPKPVRERTVTTLTGSDEFLDNGHGRDRTGPPLSQHTTIEDALSPSFSTMSSSSGSKYNILGSIQQQSTVHRSQRPQFSPNDTLPPGQGDLEALERLKQVIKNGQHELYRAFPEPAALASLYQEPIDLGTLNLSSAAEKAALSHAVQKSMAVPLGNSDAQLPQPLSLTPVSTLPVTLSSSGMASGSSTVRNDSEAMPDLTHAQQMSRTTSILGLNAEVLHQSPPAPWQNEEPPRIKPDVRVLELQPEEHPPPAPETAASVSDSHSITEANLQSGDSRIPPATTSSDMITKDANPATTTDRRREYERSSHPSPPDRPLSPPDRPSPRSYEREPAGFYERRAWDRDRDLDHSRHLDRPRPLNGTARRPSLQSRIEAPRRWEPRPDPLPAEISRQKSRPESSSLPLPASKSEYELGATGNHNLDMKSSSSMSSSNLSRPLAEQPRHTTASPLVAERCTYPETHVSVVSDEWTAARADERLPPGHDKHSNDDRPLPYVDRAPAADGQRQVFDSAPAVRRPPPTSEERHRMLEERRPAVVDRRPLADERRPDLGERRPALGDRSHMEERLASADDRRPSAESMSRSVQSSPRSAPVLNRSAPENFSRPPTSASLQSARPPAIKPLARAPTLQERISGAPPLLPRSSDAPRVLPPRAAALEDRLSSRGTDSRPRRLSNSDDDAVHQRPANVPRPIPPEQLTAPAGRDGRRLPPSIERDNHRPPAARDRFSPVPDVRPHTSHTIPDSPRIPPPIAAGAPLPVLQSSRSSLSVEHRPSGPPRGRSPDAKGYYERPKPIDSGRIPTDLRYNSDSSSAEISRNGHTRLDNEPRASVRGRSPPRSERIYPAELPHSRDDLERERSRDWYARGYDDRVRTSLPPPFSSTPHWDDKDRRLSSQPLRGVSPWDREPYSAGPSPYNSSAGARFDDHNRATDFERGHKRLRTPSPALRDPFYPSALPGYDSRAAPPIPTRDPYPPSHAYDDLTRARARSRSPIGDRRPPFKRARDDGYDAAPVYYTREEELLPPPPLQPHGERVSYADRDYYSPYETSRRTPPASYRR